MTILSRCQRFDFRRIAIEEIIKTLATIAHAETITIESGRLDGDRQTRRWISSGCTEYIDQVRSFCGNDIKTAELLKAFNVVDQEIYFRVSDFLKSRDAQGAIHLVDEVIKCGYDLREFVGGLTEHLRNLLIVRSRNQLNSSKYLKIIKNAMTGGESIHRARPAALYQTDKRIGSVASMGSTAKVSA